MLSIQKMTSLHLSVGAKTMKNKLAFGVTLLLLVLGFSSQLFCEEPVAEHAEALALGPRLSIQRVERIAHGVGK